MLLNYQQHDPSTCHIPELSGTSTDTSCLVLILSYERTIWQHAGGADLLWSMCQTLQKQTLGSATRSSWDSRHNWHIPLDKIFKTSAAGMDSHWWFLWEITMSWGDQPSWGKPSARFPQLRIWQMGILPWVRSFYMRMQSRWQEKENCHRCYRENSPWGTRDRATLQVSFQWLIPLHNSDL